MSSAPAEHPQLIVIVEDDRAVLDALEFTLQTEGFAVRGFGRGLDALHSPEVFGADCLVIDYAMPEMDGIALLQALRRHGVDCPAIIIASNPTARCRQEALASNAPLIEKPMLDDVLSRCIRELLAPP